jgi:formylglycine-generating enzyme required for sulfatase activity
MPGMELIILDYLMKLEENSPTPGGLYDMSGNVFESCQDWLHTTYTGAPTDGSSWESPSGTQRVLRGGNFVYVPRGCRSAIRLGSPPDSRYSRDGFRLARTQ